MFGNLMMVGAVIAIFWLVCFAFYMYTSRQQEIIAEEIDYLKKQLNENADNI